jgi:hypothetical protein
MVFAVIQAKEDRLRFTLATSLISTISNYNVYNCSVLLIKVPSPHLSFLKTNVKVVPQPSYINSETSATPPNSMGITRQLRFPENRFNNGWE